jgi:5'(3')-deoxyribonucleotidase
MIYLDMDGVLADFVQHLQDLKIPNNHQWFEPRDTWTKETWAGEKIKTDAMHSPGFWNTLPVMPGGKQLWDFCQENYPGQVAVLTCKPQSDSPDVVGQEKFEWINLKLGPIFADRFFCVAPGTKKEYVLEGDTLVDDDKRHTEGFVPGAMFVHHKAEYDRNGHSVIVTKNPDVEATIAELKRIYG